MIRALTARLCASALALASVAALAQQPSQLDRAGFVAERVNGRGVLTSAHTRPLDEYVNGLLQRLDAADTRRKKSRKLAIEGFVAPTVDINAFAHRDGTVIVTLGALAYVPSDDALAFLLAHELSHVRNGDYGSGKRDLVSQNAENLLGIVLIAGIATQSSEASNLLAALAGNSAMQDFRRKVSIPRWSREQELRADKEALALMTRAGFSAEGSREALNLFAALEARQTAAPRAAPPRASTGDPLSAFIVENLVAAWNSMLDVNAQSHPDASARLAALQDSFETAFTEAPDRKPTNELDKVRQSIGVPGLLDEVAALEKLEASAGAAPAPVAARELSASAWGSYVLAKDLRRTLGDRDSRTLAAFREAAAKPDAMLEARLGLADLAYSQSGGFHDGSIADLTAVKQDLKAIQKDYDDPYYVLPYLTRVGFALSEAHLKRPAPTQSWSDVAKIPFDIIKSKGLPDAFNQVKCIGSAPTALVKKTCGDLRWLKQ